MNKPQLNVFKSIAELMRYLDQPGPLHPLIAIMKYDDRNIKIGHPGDRICMDFYKISFKTKFTGKVKYGQRHYDFEDGGMAFIAPHQILTTSADTDTYEGYSLFFHPDLLRGYPLADKIQKYGFFHYDVSEALFLSAREKQVITLLFNSIADELNNNTDAFSQDIFISQLEHLLNYSNRFYNRQFITRKAINHDLITQMDKLLTDHLFNETTLMSGLPTVQYIAEQLNVSPHYLSDMLRSLTGQNTQQHIHNKLLEKARDMLSSSNLTVAEIAYRLGFEYPQSFSKLFKKKVGYTPLEYRQLFN